MGEILEIHREFALVDRMSDLLKHPPKTEYTETLCYSVFSAIIPWVCQRLRSQEYRFVFDELECEILPEHISKYFRMNIGFAVPNSGMALVLIRNAISHADARRVFPINDHGFLRGFKWQLKRKEKEGEIEIGTLSMRTLGIVCVGAFYADFFCNSLRALRLDQSDDEFYHKVKVALVEAA